MKSAFQSRVYPHWFLLPVAAIFTIFFVVPAAFGLWLAFTNASTLSTRQDFIGFDNFALLLVDNRDAFFGSIVNQIIYAIVTTIGKTGIGVALAFLLNRAFRGRNFVRAIVYLPIMFSTIVVGIVFNFILAQKGLLNQLLDSIGLTTLTQDWLGSFDLALYSVAGIDIWMGVGWTVVIVLAAIQAIPGDVIESAELDGANGWQLTFRIKIPFIMHAIGLATLLTFVSGMKAFEIIYATTGGGPGHATEVMTTFISKALATTNLGYAASASFVQFALICTIAFVINYIVKRLEANQE